VTKHLLPDDLRAPDTILYHHATPDMIIWIFPT
jgi:hypothetical protein